jgi:hypothetical protein
MKIDKSLAFDPSVAGREQAVKDGVKGLKKQEWLSFGALPSLLGFDAKSPTAMVDAREKLGAAFKEFLTDNKAGPERRDVVGGWVKAADPQLFESVSKQVFQEWLDRR